MKRVIPMMVICASVLTMQVSEAYAQKNVQQTKDVIFGLRAGIGASVYTLEEKEHPKSITTPVLGLSADIKLARIPLYLETGLYYMDMGTQFRNFKSSVHAVSRLEPEGSDNDKINFKYHNHSLMIPAVVSYHLGFSRVFCLQPYSGIYMSFGTNNEQFDIGLREGIGMTIGHFYLGAGINFGLLKQEGKLEFERKYDHVNYYELYDCHHLSLFMDLGFKF